MSTQDTTLQRQWIQHRDSQAFAELVNRHAGMVYAACQRILQNSADAEDVVQECFLRLSQTERVIDRSLAGWLHRVASNRALDLRRSEQRRSAREQTFNDATSDDTLSEWKELQPHIDQAIANLPENLREALVLHYFEGLTHAETARVVGLSRSATTRRIQHAVDAVRENLRTQGFVTSLGILTALLTASGASAIPAKLQQSLMKIGLAPGGTGIAKSTRGARQWRRSTMIGVIVAILVVGLGLGAIQFLDALSASQTQTLTTPTQERTELASANTNEQKAEVKHATTETGFAAGTPAFASIEETGDEAFLELQVVDIEDQPVAGSSVYLEVYSHKTPPMISPTSTSDKVSQVFGPFVSDTNGAVRFPVDLKRKPNKKSYFSAYARGPGDLVGAWLHTPRSSSEDKQQILALRSVSIPGTVIVPPGFDVTNVRINLLSLRLNDGGRRFGVSFPASDKINPPRWPDLFTVTPASDGNFTFPALPFGGSFYLAATAPGLGEAQFYAFGDKAVDKIDIEMFPEATISGRVIIEPGSRAAPGVAVLARPGGRSETLGVTTPFVTTTDHLGRYEFLGLPEETYSVYTQVRGNPPGLTGGVVTGIETKPGHQVDGIDLILEPGARMTGTVIDKDSREPLEDIVLVAMNPTNKDFNHDPQAIETSISDAEGNFGFRLPTGASYIYLAAIPHEYMRPESNWKHHVEVAPDEQWKPKLLIELSKDPDAIPADSRATLRGRVVDQEGAPLAEVPVAVAFEPANDKQGFPYSGHMINTDKDGNYVIEVFPHGKYRIIAGGGRFSRAESEEYKPSTDDTKVFADLAVVSYTEQIGLSITDKQGNPVEGAWAIISEIETGERIVDIESDSNGLIACFIPSRSVHVIVGRRDLGQIDFTAEPGEEYEVVLNADAESSSTEDSTVDYRNAL